MSPSYIKTLLIGENKFPPALTVRNASVTYGNLDADKD
jgi:hypothetical protein